MNRRISGWKLALLLLIPLALIAAAIWIGLQALNDSDSANPVTVNNGVASSDVAPTATAVPVTQPVAAPQPTAPPTALPLPTEVPTEVPTAAPEPEPTEEPTPVPAPTSPPAPTAAPAPVATAAPAADSTTTADTTDTADTTTDAPLGDVTIACGTIPKKLAQDEAMGPFEATTVPETAAAALRFQWNFGNGFTVGSQNTPTVSYDTSGDYTVTITGTDIATGQTFTNTCGTVTVGSPAPATVDVKCSVKPKDTTLKIADALPGDIMVLTVSWTPKSVPLRLTYGEFTSNDPIVLVNDDASPNVQENGNFGADDSFVITWQYLEKDLRGRLSCLAYPK